MSEWRVKSESDTDQVWAEYNSAGKETGNYEYRKHDGTVQVPAAEQPVRVWPWYAAAAAVGVAAGAASRLLPW